MVRGLASDFARLEENSESHGSPVLGVEWRLVRNVIPPDRPLELCAYVRASAAQLAAIEGWSQDFNAKYEK